MNIKVTPSSVFRNLSFVTLLLTIAYIVGFLCKFYYNLHYLNGLFRLFDLDAETNIPSYFSALELLVVALLLFIIAKASKGTRDYKLWYLLAIVFVFLSLDEASMIHEMMIGYFRRNFHMSGLLFDAWVVPYGFVMIVALFYYIPFLLRLPRKTMVLFIVSGAFYVGGAAVIEMFEGKYEEIHGNQNIPYCIYVAFEESFEMFGMVLFIYTLLRHMALNSIETTIKVAEKD
jgi:hypothetical protein